MFCFKLVVCVVLYCAWVKARPAQDVQIVESTIREVRAAPPDDLHLAETGYGYDYGADDEDSVGYLKRSEDGGSDGYKHFDSYHKKDGDKYGYEKHTAFGKGSKAEYDSGNKEETSAPEEKESGSYKVSEELNEDDKSESYVDDGDSAKYVDVASDSGEYNNNGDENAHYTGEQLEYDDGESANYEENADIVEADAEDDDDY